ncbi:uncharacterized protein [Procambarus clarkii]
MLKWLCCGKFKGSRDSRKSTSEEVFSEAESDEEISSEVGWLPRHESVEARDDAESCTVSHARVPAKNSLEEPKKETPGEITKLPQLQHLHQPMPDVLLSSSGTVSHLKSFNNVENVKDNQGKNDGMSFEEPSDVSHSKERTPKDASNVYTCRVEARPRPPGPDLRTPRQNWMTLNDGDKPISEEVKCMKKRTCPTVDNSEEHKAHVQVHCQQELNFTKRTPVDLWPKNCIPNVSEQVNEIEIKNELNGGKKQVDSLCNQSPCVKDHSATHLQSPCVKDHSATHLQSPCVKDHSATHLQSPRVKDHSATHLQSPRVKDHSATHLQSPCVKDHSATHLQSPCVKDHSATHLQSPCVKDHSATHLQSPRVKDHSATHLQSPRVKDHSATHLQSPCVKDHSATHLQSPCVKDHSATHLQSPCVKDHSATHLQSPCVKDHSATHLQSPRVTDHSATHPSSWPSRESCKQDSKYEISSTPESHLICPKLFCLYNQRGQLCNMFGKQYISTYAERIPGVRVPELIRAECRLVWRGSVPLPLSDLPDQTPVRFDAVELPNVKTFQAIAIWQNTKPNLITEPHEESYVFIDSRALPVIRFVFENNINYVKVNYDNKLVKSEFTNDVIFIDENTADTSDLVLLASLQPGRVFARVCKMVRGDASGTLTYTCNCVWFGKAPKADLLPMDFKRGEVYKREPSGLYIRENVFQRLWCDVPATLKAGEHDCCLVCSVEKTNLSLPVSKEVFFVQNDRITLVPPFIFSVKAHILEHVKQIGKSGWEILMVQLPKNYHDIEANLACALATLPPTPSQETHSTNSKLLLQERNIESQRVPPKSTSLHSIRSLQEDDDAGTASERQVQAGGQLSPAAQLLVGGDSSDKSLYDISSTGPNSVVRVEDCIWHFGSISNGVVTHFNKTILVNHDKFFVNGVRTLPNDPLAKYSSKSVQVNAFVQSLLHPVEVLGRVVTHKALVAWQGDTQLEAETLLKVQSDTRFPKWRHNYDNTPITKDIHVQPNRHFLNAGDAKCSKTEKSRGFMDNIQPLIRCVSYVGACTWKRASISLGIVTNRTNVIVVKHDTFFVDRVRVPTTDPLVKFCDGRKFVNVEAAVLYPSRTVLGHTATHQAVVAWHGRKPPEAQTIVTNYLKRNPSKIRGCNIRVNVTGSCKSFLMGDEAKDSKPVHPEGILPKERFRGRFIRDATGKLTEIKNDFGILKVSLNFGEDKVLVYFHRSVVYIHKNKCRDDKPLYQQMNMSNPKQWHCSMQEYYAVVGETSVQYKATLVWGGKKPTEEDIQVQTLMRVSPADLQRAMVDTLDDTPSSSLPASARTSGDFSPSNTSPSNKSPSNKSPSNKSSSNKSPSNKSPNNKNPVNKSPTNTSEPLKNPQTTSTAGACHTASTPLNETEDDAMLVEGSVTELQGVMGRLQVVGGEQYYFNRNHSFLYGVRVHSLQLQHIFRLGMSVRCRLKKHSSGLWGIEGVWAGKKYPQDPCAVYALLRQWCLQHHLSHHTLHALLHEAGHIADESTLTFGSSSEITNDIPPQDWLQLSEDWMSPDLFPTTAAVEQRDTVQLYGEDWMSPDLFPTTAAVEQRDTVQLCGEDWMSPDLFPTTAAVEQRDTVQLMGDWMSPDLFPTAAAGEEKDTVEL